MVRLDRHVDQFVVSAQQRSIRIAALRFVRYNGNTGSELTSTDLPDVKIANE